MYYIVTADQDRRIYVRSNRIEDNNVSENLIM